ncbi:hypothetical protein [Persicobacter sp. CCB-QB2]|uniref:hypothetical protein n=1 Tax=Persicobacter sp. CCB-QB2 TaxID=1561025 RepID=UPI0006A94BB2|nr:hypothetical protein [Persicobacter sp. CCB-QB2]
MRTIPVFDGLNKIMGEESYFIGPSNAFFLPKEIYWNLTGTLSPLSVSDLLSLDVPTIGYVSVK